MPAANRPRRPPLDEPSLNELALRYVGRFATTRAKLGGYLSRKVRERGWGGSGEPPIAGIVERCVRNGFVDDASFALSKARSLSARGYGAGRLRQSLYAAGVDEADAIPARDLAATEAVDAALRFARRRQLGPFAQQRGEREAREKAMAAMVRAGHSFALARAIVDIEPGEAADESALADLAGR